MKRKGHTSGGASEDVTDLYDEGCIPTHLLTNRPKRKAPKKFVTVECLVSDIRRGTHSAGVMMLAKAIKCERRKHAAEVLQLRAVLRLAREFRAKTEYCLASDDCSQRDEEERDALGETLDAALSKEVPRG